MGERGREGEEGRLEFLRACDDHLPALFLSPPGFLLFAALTVGMLAASPSHLHLPVGRLAALEAALAQGSVCVCAVVVAELGRYFANEQDRRRIISKESVVDSERMAIALTLNTYLFDNRTTSNVKMNENLATVTQDLLHTTSALGKVGKLIEKSSKETPTNRQIISALKALNRNKRSNEI